MSKLSQREALIIIFPAILIIVFISFFFKCNNSIENFQEKILPDHFHGIVVKKYIDNGNHANGMIIIEDENKRREIYANSWTGLYDNIEINDSLYKVKGDSTIVVKSSKTNELTRRKYFFGKGTVISH